MKENWKLLSELPKGACSTFLGRSMGFNAFCSNGRPCPEHDTKQEPESLSSEECNHEPGIAADKMYCKNCGIELKDI